MADPKFLRLRQGVSNRHDPVTLWSISGNEVVAFPDDPQAQKFVRAQLAQGILEPAGKAEFDESEQGDAPLPEEVTFQEHHIQVAAAAERAKEDNKKTPAAKEEPKTEEKESSES